VALGGIIVAGIVYTAIGLTVMKVGYQWIETLMPPPVTGAVVAVIGLNLAPIAVKGIAAARSTPGSASQRLSPSGSWRCAHRGSRGACRSCWRARRLCAVCAPHQRDGPRETDRLQRCRCRAWVGLPKLSFPVWDAQAIALIAPVAIVLVAENLGHVKAVAAITGQNLDPILVARSSATASRRSSRVRAAAPASPRMRRTSASWR
jgi:xanthine/uracil permease